MSLQNVKRHSSTIREGFRLSHGCRGRRLKMRVGSPPRICLLAGHLQATNYLNYGQMLGGDGAAWLERRGILVTSKAQHTRQTGSRCASLLVRRAGRTSAPPAAAHGPKWETWPAGFAQQNTT